MILGVFLGGHGKNPIWLVWVVWVVAFCQCSPNLSGLSPGWVLIVSPFFCVRMWYVGILKGKGQLQWIIFGGWWFIDKNVQLHAIGAVAHGLPLAWCTTGIETLSLKLRTLNLLQQTPPLPCHDGTLGCTPHNGIVNFHQNLSESYQRAECRKSQVIISNLNDLFPPKKAFNLSEPLAKELIKAAPSRDVHGARRPG